MIYRPIEVTDRDIPFVIWNVSIDELCMSWLMLKVRMHNPLVVATDDLHIAGSRVINDRRVT